MKRIDKFFFDKVFKILISSSNKTIFAKHFLFYSFIAILLIIFDFFFMLVVFDLLKSLINLKTAYIPLW